MKTNAEIQLEKIRDRRDLSVFDLCSITDFNEEDLSLVFEIAENFKKNPKEQFELLRGLLVFNVFFENSTRTRCSFEVAAKKLGANLVNISTDGSSVKKGETPLDTLQNLAALKSDVFVMRTGQDGLQKALAPNVSVPIINAGDGKTEHPTQALLDFFTIQENFGNKLEGKIITFVGDTKHSRVYGSLKLLARKKQMQIRIFSPKSFLPDDLENIETYDDLEKAVAGADIVYKLRTQKERGAVHEKGFTLTPKIFELAKKDAMLMYPGPIFWDDGDLSEEFRTHARNFGLVEVENGLYVRMAILWLFAKRIDKKTKPFIHA